MYLAVGIDNQNFCLVTRSMQIGEINFKNEQKWKLSGVQKVSTIFLDVISTFLAKTLRG